MPFDTPAIIMSFSHPTYSFVHLAIYIDLCYRTRDDQNPLEAVQIARKFLCGTL
jgi:hypothetical protein